MNEVYIVDGKKYSVGQTKLEQFLLDFPNAVKEGKEQGLTGDPTGGQNNTGSQLDDGSSELVSWFDQTWLGRGIAAASTTGEATSLMSENFSNISKESINDFIKAKEQEARSHVPSERMEKFQKQYIKEGKTWSAFFRGVRNQPGLLPELFVQSIGTQLGTLIDSPVASLTAAGTGAAGGATLGAVPGAVAGFMGGLATSMEAALTFGELIETRLKEKNQEFTDENIKALLESEGTSIRNKALGRGLTIGAIEGFSGGLAGKAAVAAKQTVKGLKRSTLAAGAAGVGVEAVGGATGEIAGRAVAGQEMDAAEIGFEAITGTVTAPINVTTALLTAKKPTYKLNGEDVTYEQMKDFVDTADPVDIAKADIKMDDDYTGLGEKATQKQEIARKQVELSGDTDVVADVDEGFIENKIKTTIALAKQGKQIGSIKDAFAVENNEEAVKAYKELQDQYGKDVIGDQDVTDADGFFVPTPDGNVIIINKDVAKQTGQINVGGHELLHGIVQKHYENLDTKGKVDFIEGFKSTISKESLKYIQDIIDARNKDRVDKKTGKTIKGEGITSYSDEYLTIYSDGIVKGEITYNESLFTKFKNFLQDIFRKFGYNKEFGSGTATYNFMRDYNDTIKKSNEISKRALAVAGDTSIGVGGKLSRSGAVDAVNKIEQVLTKRLQDQNKEYTQDEFRQSDEFNKLFDSITETNGAVNNYIKSLGMSREKTQQTIQKVSDRLMGYNPRAERKTGSKKVITIGERIMSDAQFAKLDAARDLAIKSKKEDKTLRIDAAKRTKEGESTFDLEDSSVDAKLKALETEDMSPAAQAKKKADKAKGKKAKESEFRNRVNFKTGSQIYNEIMTAAVKSLIRAYGKTLNIKDVAARERAVVKEIQKEHNNLTSPLFKQIKNWLSYGLPQEVIPRGTKDIYFQNLREFREDITKLVSTADLVQVERLISEVDRIFTVYKGTLTKRADVEKAVDNLELPPDAIRKYDKDKKVSVYDKTTPSETQIVAFANQPLKIPAKDKSGNVMRNDSGDIMMIRSGLKGTRKDGITKNIVNGLVLDAVMEARQSQEVKNKLKELDVDVTSVQELSVATGRPANLKLSKYIAQGNIIGFAQEAINNQKKIYFNFGKEDNQRRKALTVIDKIIKEINNEDILLDMFVHMRSGIEQGNSFIDIVNNTYNEFKSSFEGVEGNLYAAFFQGEFSTTHLKNILGLAKKITEAQINSIAFNDAIADVQENNSDENIQKFLRNYSKQIRTAAAKKDLQSKFVYVDPKTGKAFGSMTKNEDIVNNIIIPTGNTNFTAKEVSKGKKRIFYKNTKELKTYQNSTETKDVFKNNNEEKINKALETNLKESEEAIQFVIDIITSDMTSEAKKAHIKSFFADTDAGGRKIAKFAIMAIGYKGETVLDHRVPINVVIKKIFNTIDSGTKNTSDLKVFLESTRVNNIPSEVNDFLNKPVDKGGLGKQAEGGMELMENSGVQSLMDKLRVQTKNYNGTKPSKSTKSEKLTNAVSLSRSTNNPTKGITVLDFDDTLATTKSLVKFTRPDGTTGTLNAEQYASTYENLLDQGYTFDFSEFNKVVKGKLAPLFKKALKLQGKFGPKNMFVLTARPPAAQKAIFDFLKANGLNIPIDNITGLGNSTAEAKALWMAEKVGEGFNDFYFADDALQNVQAVKNMLDQLDVKSKVQQARVKFSKTMNNTFNDILQEVTGIEAQKRFSAIKGRKRGDDKGKFRFFIPPSHEDFVGLLYNFMGKGRRGDAHRDFLEQALVRPLNRAYRELDTAKQAIANDYKKLNEQFTDVNDKLIKSTPDGDFTFQDAIRVYLWNKHGHKIPGLTETDQAKLTKLVESDPQLQAYAETLNVISKQKEYVAPGQAWETANIRIDLVDATGRVGRAQYLSEFIENADVLFSEENLNKIEAGYGKDFREALEDMLHRIKTGVNRPKGQSGKPNRFLNWLNASVAGVMFFNTRSALLQQLSNVNYLNFADNNIFKAGLAFANQKQYWSDFAFILNSDMLKQRRGGIGTDVNGAELVEAIKKARPDSLFDQVAIITGKLLRLGFLPTQMGDSIAIATGGAAFYRNRVNTYLKQGLSQKEAEAKAFTDFQDITQSTQQSARPDMTSQQQASWIGKLVLNFLNTPSQYNRIIKKAGSDLKNRRITKPNTTQTQSDMSNLSRILYYGAAQNLIFYGLQTALFAVMFGTEDDDESEAFLKKKERVINGSIDTILRGSGIYGVAISTLKNMMIKFAEQREKGYNKDESAVIMEALNFSPVIGIRARKIVNAEKTLNYNTKVIDEMTTLDIDNPQWSAVTNYVEAITTLPTNRLYQKTINVRNALDNQYTAFQRAMFFSGYTTWSLDLGDTEKMKKIKEKVKSKKKSRSRSQSRSRSTSRSRTR